MLETIRAAILAKLAAVPDIGRVHGRERDANNAAALRALYVASVGGAEQLRGWFVSRRAAANTKAGSGPALVATTWSITGYLALDDDAATEPAMDSLVDALVNEFWRDQNLGGAVINCSNGDAAGLQVAELGPVLFAGVLCHRARLTLTTHHRHAF